MTKEELIAKLKDLKVPNGQYFAKNGKCEEDNHHEADQR